MNSSPSKTDILLKLDAVIAARKGENPDDSYVASLLHKGREMIQKKVGEEAIETILAAESGSDQELVNEVADLWFHTLVLLAERDLDAASVLAELDRRFGLSGIDEKNARSS